MWLLMLQLVLLLLASLVCDLKTYKIKNGLLLPFVIAGCATNICLYGIKGGFLSVVGFFLPLVILYCPFMLRMVGAGDVKLFAAIGAIMGGRFAAFSIVYSFVFGGLVAVFLIFKRKILKERALYFCEYLRRCIRIRTLLPYTQFNQKKDASKFHFSIPIAGGTLLYMFLR